MIRPLLLPLLLLLASSAGANPTPIVGVETTVAGFVGLADQGPLDEPVMVTSGGDFDRVFGGTDPDLSNPHLELSVKAFFQNAGARAWVVRVADASDASLVGQDGGSPATRTGLQTLLDVDEVSVVAIPGATSLPVHTALLDHAREAGDRMALLDPASQDDVGAVLAERALLPGDARDGALYFPWVQISLDGSTRLLPPSGFVAGVYSRTEAHRSPVGDVWGASGLSLILDDDQQNLLNPEGVNALREFPSLGIRVWGARTLSSDPEWRYVSVRRTALFLEESIHEGTLWALDEPNDATLWPQLEQQIQSFLYALFLDGWFQGASADDAFFVRVDRTTMTQQDIDEGRTIMMVGFAPLRPAEFVVLSIVQQRPDPTAATGPRPLSTRLLDASPNPFNPRTTLRFELQRAGAVELALFDLAGRRVRTLLMGERLPEGRHAMVWDGRDDAGAEVASGVYRVRLRTGQGLHARAVTLVR